MLYNLQAVYKMPVSIYSDVEPKMDIASVGSSLLLFHNAIGQIERDLSI